VERLLVPDMALTAAEYFAIDKNEKVLVLLTDMTLYADALSIVSNRMDQIPSKDSMPGSLYSDLAKLYEKAVQFEAGGSITIIAVTTLSSGDITHAVPDNTGYITEGQFYVKGGVIDPFGSLSRLKQQVNGKTRDDHRPIMDGCIQLYSKCRETREKRAMGFEMSGWDKKLLAYGDAFEQRIMDLSINCSLFEGLDMCWRILAEFFEMRETGLRTGLCEKYWPKSAN
jgi:V/A-type H+/Na+-transporting ATPase subunit B